MLAQYQVAQEDKAIFLLAGLAHLELEHLLVLAVAGQEFHLLVLPHLESTAVTAEMVVVAGVRQVTLELLAQVVVAK
jgi:hypothetical protein